MTNPVTPDPNIHSPGDSGYKLSSGLSNATQIQTWARSLQLAFNKELATLIITSLGGLVPSGQAGTAETALTDLFQSLDTALQDIPSGNVTGLEAALAQAAADWNALLTAFGVPDVPSLATVLQKIQAAADAANADITDFLKTGNWSDLSAAFSDYWQLLVGNSSATGVLSTVPAPTVTSTNTTAQPLANFPDAASVASGSGWAWDSSISYGGSGGSVTFTASGVLGALVGIVAPAQPGQTATLAAQVQWSGLTAASGTSPIQLQVIPGYVAAGTTSFAPGAPVTLDSVAAGPSSSSWVALSGSYTVPSDGSVNAVQMRLVVTSDATAGSVTWAACTDTISGGFLPTMQSDLSALQSDSAASTQAFSTLVTSVESAITGYTNWSTFIAAVNSAWQTYSTAEANINASESFTIQQFFDSLLGLNSSGQVSGANVQSSTGLASLEADWNAWVQPFTATAASLESDVSTAWQNTWSGLMSMLGVGTSDLSGTSPLQQLPAAGVQGTQGIENISSTVQSTWDQIATSIANVFGWNVASSDNPLSTVSTVVQQHAQATQAALTQATSATNTLAIVTNAPVSAGLEATVESNMSVTSANTISVGGSIRLIESGQSAAACVRISQAKTLGFAQVLVEQSNPATSAFYLNFYQMDSSGDLTYLFSSGNLSSQVPASGNGWLVYDFAGANEIAVTPGDVIAVELQVRDAGVVYFLGEYSQVGTSHPTANVKNVGFSQDWGASAPSTISAANIGWNIYAPYVGLGVSNLPADYLPPVTYAYVAAGTTTLPVPAGYTSAALIALGAGGGGGGGINGGGGNGTNTTISTVTTGGTTTQIINAAGGTGGPGGTTDIQAAYGQSPGSISYDGATYSGGNEVYLATPGASPGGGGGAGYYSGLVGYGGGAGQWATQTISLDGIASIVIDVGAGGGPNMFGGSNSYGAQGGAPGGAWVVFRQ